MKCFRTITKRIIEDLIIKPNPKVYVIDFKKIEEIKKQIIEDRKRLNIKK
jgi:hypothetical protein